MVESLTRNWIAKVGSVLTALLLLWYVQANRTMTRDIQVRIEPIKLPGGLVFASKVPAYLNVQLRGPRELMDFPVSDLKILLHADRPRPGERVPFEAELQPRLPAGVEARYSKRVPLDIDRELVRELPVEPAFTTGRLKAGLRTGYFWVEPASVRVRGPSRLVSELSKVRTRNMDVRMAQAGVFEAFPTIVGLPEFTEVVSDQAELRFRMSILPTTGFGAEQGEKVVRVEGIAARCLNGLTAFDLEHEPIQATVVLPENQPDPQKAQFWAVFYCPVDAKSGDPMPLEQVPVRVLDRYGRGFLAIRAVEPAKANIKFRRTARSLIQTGRETFTKPKEK